jgi:Uma2 family endonuclease
LSFTVNEFEKMAESNGRYELIDGNLVEKSAPDAIQAYISRLLLRAYDLFDPNEQIGRLWHELNVRLDKDNSPIPDLSYWKAENIFEVSGGPGTTPDLAIEIWSEHDWETQKRQDDGRKKCLRYLERGVKVVWLINPKDKNVEIYRQGYATPQILSGSDTLSDDLIPGFTLSVRRLFQYEKKGF